MHSGVVPSRYNFAVPFGSDSLLFNAFSGALVALQGADGCTVASALTQGSTKLLAHVPEDLYRDLLAKGFLTLDERSQFEEVRRRYQDARQSTPMVLTITTTLDCNLGCYYCYQDRTPDRLDVSDVPQLVADTRIKLLESARTRLHVDWYGGEPMENAEFLEMASLALQAMCAELGVAYRASIISNGTVWPSDVSGFVARHVISHVQISFDGLAKRHDKIRRFRSTGGRDRGAGKSSFALAADLVGRLADCVRVDARFNIDRHNAEQLVEFVQFGKERGWFTKRFPVVIQPARVSDYSERSSFLKSRKLTLREFDKIRAQLRVTAGTEISVEESEVPDGYPYPKTSVCAALVKDSAVVGADGRIYRCGLQVSESHRAVGTFRERKASPGLSMGRTIPIHVETLGEIKAQAQWWGSFDPCDQPTCSQCSFLPICLGGCPKKHLEGDRSSLDEQGAFWRQNLGRLLVNAYEPGAVCEFEIPLSQQFRLGIDQASVP